MRKLVYILTVMAVTLAFASAKPASAAQIKISADAKTPVRIVCGKSAGATDMGRYLRGFLASRGCAMGAKIESSVRSGYAGPQLILATAGDIGSMKIGIAVPRFPEGSRDDAYVLDARKGRDGATLLLVGKSADGVRSAVARFICRVANDGKSLWIDEGREMNDPFVKIRMVMVGNSARRQMPFGSPFKDCDFETWSLDRIRTYPDLFWQFGFNGLQGAECRGYGSVADKDLRRIRKANQELFRGARDRHMFTSMFIWGDCLFDEGATYSWNNPTEQRVMRLFQKDLAEDYAPIVDHFVIHIGDPGGCTRDGCDLYKTPQQLTASYLEAFRKVNPKVQGTLSTWANSFFWRKSPKQLDMSNYGPMFPGMANQTEYAEPIPDAAKFMDSTFMPADVGIALNRNYNAEQAEMIASHGKPVDIWSWYIGDNEMINTYWFTMTHTDSILSQLPDQARNQIRWNTHEICFHGWPQVINTYVGAQKLWNPRRPLDDIEREFCVAGFGPMNSDAVLGLYRVCENGWTDSIPHPSDFGTAAHIQRLSAVLAKADSIRFPTGWKPNFAFPVPAPKYVDMLKARVQLILAVSKAKQAVDTARAKLGVAGQIKAKSLALSVVDSSGSPIIVIAGIDMPLRLEPGKALGQTFGSIKDFGRVGVMCPTWGSSNSGLTIALYDSVGGKLLASAKVENHQDNEMAWLDTHQIAGSYYLELSNPTGDAIGVYGSATAETGGTVMVDRLAVKGEPDAIQMIKKNAIDSLPNLPIDPIYKQDSSIANPGFRTLTFAEMIERL